MVKDFLEKHVEAMPAGAPNYLTFFVEAPRIYDSYLRWCRDQGAAAVGKAEFVGSLLTLFPMAKLCDIRGEKQFTGVRFNAPSYKSKR